MRLPRITLLYTPATKGCGLPLAAGYHGMSHAHEMDALTAVTGDLPVRRTLRIWRARRRGNPAEVVTGDPVVLDAHVGDRAARQGAGGKDALANRARDGEALNRDV